MIKKTIYLETWNTYGKIMEESMTICGILNNKYETSFNTISPECYGSGAKIDQNSIDCFRVVISLQKTMNSY